ncbi:MAG: phosphoribosylformylglycinamidine synthase subunit PurS [Saprospiraceae bacterium]|nr:phosphoribosylformylglycinamidine synthase subunit PurS [Saprospiraceae bacterium]
MKFIAHINIMPHKELLDPQGKTVAKSLEKINVSGVEDVRIGKHIHITLEADSKESAETKVDNACKKLLANVIMEKYDFTLSEA